VDRQLPREAIRRIRQAGAPVLGVVTNARKSGSEAASADGYGGYGYGRYGRYGYGYGYGGYANDPAIAYGYYKLDEEGNRQAQEATAQSHSGRARQDGLGQRLQSWGRHVRRWLDGG
jgi:Mrp family chromosome partitioning ATPase